MKVPAATLLILGLSSASAAEIPLKPISPVIAFSENEQTVSIAFEKGRWTFHRPVVSPWQFKAMGKVYWVDPRGEDSSEGTSSSPFRTIGKGVSVVGPGDLLSIRAGTYVEALLIRKSGQGGRPIIISCAPSDLGKVKITPPREYVEKNPRGGVITLHTARHVWINGLVIEGPRGRPEAPKMETYGANGITWAGKAGQGCRATNCVVYGNVHCGLKEMGHGGSGILMEGNLIFENGTEGRDHGIYCPADDLTINGNIIFNNAGYGIHSYSSPKHQTISRNICFGNRAAGIILAGNDNKVFRNVCAFNGQGIMYFRGGCSDNVVQNNIFAFNGTDRAYDNGGGRYGDPARNADDYNCYFPGKPDGRLHSGSHEILADPWFMDAQKGDFRLKETSPCRGQGVLSSGKKPDLGAF